MRWKYINQKEIMLLITKVDELFIRWDKPNSPGCAIAVIQNEEIIYQRGYGMANLEYDIPITSKRSGQTHLIY